jgi:hypothetical protein
MAIENQGADPGPSEDAFFDNAVEGVTPAKAEPAPAAAAPVEKSTTTTEATAPATDGKERPQVDDDAPQVPSWRVREINEEKRAALAERDALKAERDRLAYEQQEFRRHIQQQQERPAEPEAPDPLLDPKGWTAFQEARWEARLVNERRENSLQLAKRTYKEEFDQAYEVAKRYVDPALRARMQQSPDPGETLMHWFRDLKVRAEVGNDPAAYRARVREEAMKDPEFRKAAMEAWGSEASATDANGRPNVRLAPSLNAVSRSNAALRSALQSDVPDGALFDNIIDAPRRR